MNLILAVLYIYTFLLQMKQLNNSFKSILSKQYIQFNILLEDINKASLIYSFKGNNGVEQQCEWRA